MFVRDSRQCSYTRHTDADRKRLQQLVTVAGAPRTFGGCMVAKLLSEYLKDPDIDESAAGQGAQYKLGYRLQTVRNQVSQ